MAKVQESIEKTFGETEIEISILQRDREFSWKRNSIISLDIGMMERFTPAELKKMGEFFIKTANEVAKKYDGNGNRKEVPNEP
jgi:hypothetical protein